MRHRCIVEAQMYRFIPGNYVIMPVCIFICIHWTDSYLIPASKRLTFQEGKMAQSLYFNETCDPVDLTLCIQYYVDPCDCTQFYQCAQNQPMFHKPCANGTIYSDKTWVCVYPNDAICQTLSPWERCNVTKSRMEQLRSMCFKSTSDSNNTGNSTPNSNYNGNSTPDSNNTGNSTTNSNNTGNSDQNTNGISSPLITQTILPTVFGVLLPVIIIGLVIHRYRNRRIITMPEESPGTTERNHESHTSDPYNSLYSFATSIPEYCPYPTQQFNPTFDVDLSSSGSSSYIIVEEFDSTPSPPTMPGASHNDREYIARGFHSDNRPEIEIVSKEDRFNLITGQSDTTPHPLSMPQPCEADRPVPNSNSQEDQIGSSGGSSYESLRGSDSTTMPQPSHADEEFANKTVSSEDSADRSVPNLNSQEHEIASSGGSSYVSIRGSDTTAMSQPSHADKAFANKTVSSEDSDDRPVPNFNSQEDEIASSGGSSYESIRGSDTTAMPQPSHADQKFANKTVSSEDSGDIPVPNRNSQEDEIASSGGSSYESLRGSDSTAMPQPSDADEEIANTTVSSEDSAYEVVQQSDPLFHPYISGNGPWPHKIIFSTKDHFLPPCTTFETT